MKSLQQHREEICRFGRMIHREGLVASTDGNLSVRLEDGRVLTTPTSLSKGMLEPEDLVIVDMDGQKLEGDRNPSSELGMHLLIYKRRPDVRGIVHAHPPTATGFASAGLALNEAVVAEIVLSLGCVPLAKYGTTGTAELLDSLEPFLPHYDAILMANHGVVTFGDTLCSAFMKMETVEHFAKISLVTHLLGRKAFLTNEDVSKLMLARSRYEATANKRPVHIAPGFPITAEYADANPGDTVVENRALTKDDVAAVVAEVLRQMKVRA